MKSFNNQKPINMYIVLSPDGFPIHFEETYSSFDEAKEAFNEWLKRYQTQGYYSSVSHGRIPLDEVYYYCELKSVVDDTAIDNN
jgi:AAA+ superfamily predicted ATPase